MSLEIDFANDGGDMIEIKLMTSSFNTYFKTKAHIHNQREMAKLIEDLRMKGVRFKINWLT